MRNFRSLLANPAIYGTIIISGSLFLSSVINYLLQIFLGRNLSVEDYGTFNALLSLSVILGIVGSVLSTTIIKISAELKAQDQFDRLTELFIKLSVLGGIILLILIVSFSTFSTLIGNGLNIRNYSLFVFFGAFLGTTLINAIPSSYLQGLLRFKGFGFYSIMNSVFRAIAPIILVLSGFSLIGVFLGLAISNVISYVMGILILFKNFRRYKPSRLNDLYRKMLSLGGPVFFITIGMLMLNNIDLILVKKFFSEYDTGIYSAVVTVGKVFLFGASTIPIVMLPQISEAFARNNNVMKLLYNFLFLQLILVGGGLVTFSFFPKFITTLLFGEKFLPAVPYIPLFTIFIAIYIMSNFLTTFFLGIGRSSVYVFHLACVVLQVVCLFIFHSTLYQVIFINTLIAFVLLVCLTVFLFKIKKDLEYNLSAYE